MDFCWIAAKVSIQKSWGGGVDYVAKEMCHSVSTGNYRWKAETMGVGHSQRVYYFCPGLAVWVRWNRLVFSDSCVTEQ